MSMLVSLFLCGFVCPRAYLQNYTSSLHLISAHVTHRRGSVVWRRCDMSCTSGFTNDVMSARNGPYGLMSIAFQRVTSLRRRAQALAPLMPRSSSSVASFRAPRLDESILQGVPRSEPTNAPLPCLWILPMAVARFLH